MNTLLAPPVEPALEPAALPAPRMRRQVALDAAILAGGTGLAVATAVDGPQPWPLVRGLVIASLVAGLTWWWRGWPSRRSAAAVVVQGLLGTIGGIALGVMYFIKVGATLASVSGLIALIGGLVAVVLGSIEVLHRTRWWHKLLAIPAGLVVALMLGAPLMLAVMSTNSPPLELGDRTPADAGLDYEDVELTTADGVRLEAWYVPSQNGAAVVLLAGAGSTRDDEIDRAAALAEHGFGVLLHDVRGHGGSDGEAMLLGWYGELDVEPAVDYLLERPDVTEGRVGVVGMSMGGQQAVAAFGADDRIRGVVADGTVGRHSSELDAPTAVDRLMGWLTMETSELLTDAPHPTPLVEAVADAAPRPILVIAAENPGIEVDFAEKLSDASPATVEVWVAPDVSHTQAFDKHREQWISRVTSFLDEALA